MPTSPTSSTAQPTPSASEPGRTSPTPEAGSLLQAMPWGLLALAPNGTVAFLNPAAEALWGVPAAAVLGHAPAQVQPAVLPPALLQALASTAEVPADATYWLPNTQQWVAMRTALADDGHRWVYWDNVTAHQPALYDPGNLSADTETQELQRTKAALRAAKESYRTLFEAMAQGFCVVEVLFDDARQPINYRFLVTNPAFEQQTGLYNAVGETIRELRPGHEGYWYELYGQIALTGESQRFARMAEQLGRFYEVYAFRVGNPGENKVAILFSDVSQARLTEEALHEAEASYRALFNSIDEGYFLCDVLFNQQEIPIDILYRDANPAAMRMVKADYRGRRLHEIDPAYENYWVEIFGRVALTGVSERMIRYAEPNRMWYDFYVLRVGDATSRRVAVVFWDITDRKRREAHAAFLATVQDDLSLLATPDEILQAVGTRLGDYLRLSACYFCDIDETQEYNLNVCSAWNRPGTVNSQGTYRLHDFWSKEVAQANHADEITIIRDTQTDTQTDEHTTANAYAALQIRAWVGVPFHRHGEWKNFLVVTDSEPRDWQPDEIELLGEVVQRLVPRVERARAEAALRESEEKYRAIFNSINEGFSLLDIQCDEQGEANDFIIRDANPAQDRINGSRTLIGKRVREVLPDIERKWIERYAQVAQSGQPAHFEDWSATTQRWYEVDASRVGAAGSTLVAIVYNDITERKHNEQTLRESEARIAADLAGMRLLYELQAKLADQDDALAALRDVLALACEFTGTDRGCVQLLSSDGQRLEMAVWQGYPDDSPFIDFFRYEGLATGCEVTRVQRQRLIIEDTVGYEGLEGTDAGVATYADDIRAAQSTPMASRANETIGVISTQFRQPHRPSDHELRLLDMLAWTAAEFLERHRAATALRTSEATFQKAFSISTVGQLYFTLDGNVTAANPAFVRMSGYGHEALLALNWEVLTAPEFWEITSVAARQLADQGETAAYEKQFVRPDGSRWWALCAPTRLRGHGPAAECMEFVVDITERKQAEEAVRQSEAQQAYLLALSDALRSVTDAVDMQRTAAQTTMYYFQADRCFYCEIAGDAVTIRHDAARPGLPSVAGAYSLNTMPIFRAMLQERQPVMVADARTSAVMDDYLKQLCVGFGIIAYINVPVIKNGEQVGMLCLTQATPREWTAQETALVQETAERTWAAVERAQAEEALRHSEARFRLLFESMNQGFAVCELVRDETGRPIDYQVLDINPAGERLTGAARAKFIGRGVHEMMPSLEMWWVETFAHVVETGETTRFEHYVQPLGRWCDFTVFGYSNDQFAFIYDDISARKQAEQAEVVTKAWLEAQVAERTQALSESKELLQSVFDTSLISMSVMHAVRDEAGAVQDFRIAIANRELERETGRTDLVGKLYAEEYPGIKDTGLYDLMLGVLEIGEPAGLEYFYPHEGFNKWYACQFVRLDDGLVATNLDISERKLAEAKSQEQAHFIARVNETLPDLMTVTELATGQVLYVNRDLDEAPGFEREKLLHIPQQDQIALLQIHPDDAALLPDYFARAAALADHEITTYSYRARFNTYSWRWFQVRGSVFQRDPATGAATQVLSVSQDVTAQKEAELQQAKSYQLLRQSEEVASLGSWDYDRTTDEFLWSAGMYRLFGVAQGSAIRPTIYLDFAIPEDQAVAQRIVQGLTTGLRGFEETLRIQVDGTVKTMRVKAAMLRNEAGEPLRVLGVDLDISEVQRLEAENLHMRLTQQQALFSAVLEAQESERRRMAESLHNGLGQTLYAVKLQLNQLQAAAVPAALARADQLLADAIRQTRTISHQLVPTVLKEFGLQAALRDICRAFSSPQLRFSSTVELDTQPPLPQSLQVAIYRMAQELAQNVVKHAHATEASLALETVPGFVLLRAEDNGVGFAPSPTSPPGIGLRTIRDQVALLGGTVHTGSSPAFGTYVRIRFPLPTPASPLA